MKTNRIAKMTLVAPAGIWATPLADAQSPAQTGPNTVNLTGYVSCTEFGRGAITARKGMSVAQTIQYCVTFRGGDYTLVDGNKIYRLEGDRNPLATMAGQMVNVDGQMVPEQTEVNIVQPMGMVAVSQIVSAKE